MLSGTPRWSPTFDLREPIVSFSQNAEDVRLWRVFRDVESGFYVDIGAADPSVSSVTRMFYEHGWSGINVEPSPTFDELRKQRKRDINLQIAIGESEGPVQFFLTYPYLGLSTLDPGAHAHVPDAVERLEQVTVMQRRLESVLREHASERTIHFLKVDVEGAEAQVLASSDWTSFRPIVVVVEAIASCSTAPTHKPWERIIFDAGYQFAAFDGINRFYVERGYTELIPILAYPISPLDHFVTAAMHELTTGLELRPGEESLRQSLDELAAQLAQARNELDALYRSRTWRASRALAVVVSSIQTFGKHVRGILTGH